MIPGLKVILKKLNFKFNLSNIFQHNDSQHDQEIEDELLKPVVHAQTVYAIKPKEVVYQIKALTSKKNRMEQI